MMQITLHLVGLGLVIAGFCWSLWQKMRYGELPSDDPCRLTAKANVLIGLLGLILTFSLFFLFSQLDNLMPLATGLCPVLTVSSVCAPMAPKRRVLISSFLIALPLLLVGQLVFIDQLSNGEYHVTRITGKSLQDVLDDAGFEATDRLIELEYTEKGVLPAGWIDMPPVLNKLNWKQQCYAILTPKTVTYYEHAWFTSLTGLSQRRVRRVGLFCNGGDYYPALSRSRYRFR